MNRNYLTKQITRAVHVAASVVRSIPKGIVRIIAAQLLLLVALSPSYAAHERTQFDHLTTGFELIGQHRDLPCESCHVNVIFKGTPHDCSACHGIGTAVRAMPKPANHILASDRCEACHTPIAWKPAVNFDHAEARGSCSTCHNGIQAPGKGPQHLLTDLECDACHSTIGWAGAGSFIPSNHIPQPASDACTLCHSVANDYSVYMMSHQGIGGGCAACHGAGLSFANMAPPTLVVQPANHIPIGNATCESCHSSSNFTTFSGTSMNHTAVAAMACSACHATGSTFVGAPAIVTEPANHIPIGATTCQTCHSATNFTAFSGTLMNHTGITSGCATCHGAGLSFAGSPAVKTLPGNHIPTGSTACESCHSTTNFTTFAGTGMNHAVVSSMTCATCHESGKSFVGSPPIVTRPTTNHVQTGDCSQCHTTVTFLGASNYPSNHMPIPGGSAATCALCHGNPADYSLSTTMSHNGITSGCTACHGAGLTFAGIPPGPLKQLPANHIPVNGVACESCHSASNFTTFSGTSMNHAAVGAAACSSCHGMGLTFVGAPPVVTEPSNHIPIGATTCQTCHSPTNFTTFSGTAMNHAGITNGCAACHGAGLTFVGSPAVKTMPGNHIPTGSIACEGCHAANNFSTFSGTAMNHAVVTAIACATCHETGKSFVGSPPIVTRPTTNHVQTGDCGSCHTTTTFLGATNFPANHMPIPGGSSATCSLCHANPADYSVSTTMSHSGITSGCATCHAAGLTFAGVPPNPLKQLPANHIPTNGAACESCHSASNFTTFAGTSMNHAGITSGCVTCHGAGLTFVGSPAVTTLPGNHIPTSSIACESCHATTNFTTFAGTAMNHAVVTSIACSTCHEAGKTFVGSPAIVTRPPPPHVTGGECSQCHLSTTSFKGATAMPANHIPQPAADACSLCHTNANDYSVYTMNHQGITSGCAACHAPGLSFANIAPPALAEPSTSGVKHVPYYISTCESCHSPTQFTNFAGVIFSHSKNPPGTPCMTCHEYGDQWQGISNLWVRDGPNHHKGQDCGGSGCHTISKKYAGVGRSVAAASATASPTVHAQSVTATNAGASTTTATAPAASSASTVTFNHRGATSMACVTCHNTGRNSGKPATHPVTSNSCATCHSTVAWLPVLRIDHAQVRGACASCHNGTIAAGKLSRHIQSSVACETCHTTNAWTPARFDHNALPAHTCDSCHDSVHAVGKPLTHIPTKQVCDTCHGTLAWKPAKLDHSVLQNQCAACHNSASATGKSSSHMTTQRDCATCHRYPDWSTLTFKHVSTNYPGDHRKALACIACHTTNTDQVPYVSMADVGNCGACHAPDYKSDAHAKTLQGLKYTASELKNCSGACHVYSDATHPTIAKTRSGPYHRVTDGSFKH